MTTMRSLVIIALFVPAANAAPLPVPNYSFESPSQFNPATGWTPNGLGGVANAISANGFTAPADGNQYHFLNLPTFGGPNPSSTQSDAGLIGNAMAGTYTLTVAAGRRGDGQTTDGSYLIELLAGGDVIGSETFDDPLNNFAPNSWNDLTAIAVVNAADIAFGQDLSIRLTAIAGPNNSQQGQFDNVRLDFEPATTSVPEPMSICLWSLLGMACLGYNILKRRC